ncbi:hypothetical protein DIPPA_16307 [Diplonema papillatum]|nr:hypothetical protein DIPPA_16307 [Diplonema papillatum]
MAALLKRMKRRHVLTCIVVSTVLLLGFPTVQQPQQLETVVVREADERSVQCVCDNAALHREGSCVLVVRQPEAVVTTDVARTVPRVHIALRSRFALAMANRCLKHVYVDFAEVSTELAPPSLDRAWVNATAPPVALFFRGAVASLYHAVVGPHSAFQMYVTLKALSRLTLPASSTLYDVWLPANSASPRHGNAGLDDFYRLALPAGCRVAADRTYGVPPSLGSRPSVAIGLLRSFSLFWPTFHWWPLLQVGDQSIAHPNQQRVQAAFREFAAEFSKASMRELGSVSVPDSAGRQLTVFVEERRYVDHGRVRGLRHDLLRDLKASLAQRPFTSVLNGSFHTSSGVSLATQHALVRQSDLVVAAEGAFCTLQLWSRPHAMWVVIYHASADKAWYQYRQWQYHATVARALSRTRMVVFEVHEGYELTAERIVDAVDASFAGLSAGGVEVHVIASLPTRVAVHAGIASAPVVNWLAALVVSPTGGVIGCLVVGALLMRSWRRWRVSRRKATDLL